MTNRFYNITSKDIRALDIRFNNGESIFIPQIQLKVLQLDLSKVVNIDDDPIFNHGFIFHTGAIVIDKLFLTQMLGDNILDKLMYRNGVNSVVIHYFNDNYRIKSNIPLMLCLVEDDPDSTGTTKLKYEEDDSTFTIKWIPVGTL